ncbi:NnrS family protein [Leptospira sp. 201903070]|uniref:NnrS family protein n=1 Tax=Leptospira ainlahdjerensis TaxID=2810033 RepID=A0ABS2UK78_9LEPT|nr:NnrS family protein [Leptospira ainlahdjerensis]MBM9579740.1 NnrS family protein [Leptospira ainlahdjerensis]
MNLSLNFRTHLWTNAFRPFFLGASLHAVGSILIWILILFSFVKPPSFIGLVSFHSYEMVFGFARAAILGFLFTAAQNWTKSVLIRERSLLLLFFLWVLGRFYWIEVPLISYFSFLSDFFCDLMALYLLAPKLIQKGQEHNRVIVVCYTLFGLAHGITILSILEVIPSALTLHWIHISIFSVLIFIILIAGRILPFFTSVAVAGSNPRRIQKIETWSHYGSFLFVGIESLLFWFPTFRTGAGLFAFTFAALQIYRWHLWEPWKSHKTPILRILHLSYFWLILGIVFYGFSHLGLFPVSAAFHILTVGAIGGFIYGMITRVSLGHTGRQIVASKTISFGYWMIILSFVVRVLFPIFGFAAIGYGISGILWILSFALVIFEYWNILLGPRIDSQR